MALLESIIGAPIQEAADQSIHAGDLEQVKHLWKEMVIDAERVEHSMTKIYNRLCIMRRLVHLGLVKAEDWDQACEWYRLYFDKFMSYAIWAHNYQSFVDGSGI